MERKNLVRALKRVQRNQGSPGVDGLTVAELPAYLKRHWPAIREELLTWRYEPSVVKRVEIPKPDGGMRMLGIPIVLDRFIQQAMLQVLQPQIDPTFSESSYGFRPGRRAHDAVRQAQRYVQGGRRWVVDVDLEKFFDRVNHDVLMGKLAHRIADTWVLRLIRRYLTAGLMAEGIVLARHEGTPQGGPGVAADGGRFGGTTVNREGRNSASGRTSLTLVPPPGALDRYPSARSCS